ncbi:histidinol dehydrogenase [Lentibacillus amyloliquefaciens]|uniref:Histidinol dehydrogenase n=1 Tax=Lentibacillus amyloliquefaciens TaxID=1472767 RepID=A0A0U4FKK8_9BACI|nr:histidinol dehydrogenase [Lentibacillus amyloliquefaciens]ALX49198.1 histidinol dehydrogenase [Lentibacillus amyloliquefaciens]
MKLLTTEQFFTEKQNQTDQTDYRNVDVSVLEIIADVQKSGDDALLRLTEKFDGVLLDQLTVSEEEFWEAEKSVSQEFKRAIRTAKENITAFHANQTEQSWFMNQTDGITLGQKVTAIERVGVYIPGGKASYPSSVLMNVIPAKLAGVEEIIITTPPNSDGKVNPYVLLAAKEAGVKAVYKVGGAQAIAALAYGTETIQKVFKIVGPGNAYVARAKKWVFGDVAIDMIAGPSEICIVADDTAPPRFVAADLLSQAEHDEDARPILITTSEKMAEAVQEAVAQQTEQLERKAIIKESLANNGRIIFAETLSEAFDTANKIAPEHLQLMIREPFENLANITNAGAIFLGHYSPEPLGDYAAGPNHTLPTSGTAAFSSPLGVYDFVKKSSVIHYPNQALDRISRDIITLANAEGLSAHSQSIQIRKDEQDDA